MRMSGPSSVFSRAAAGPAAVSLALHRRRRALAMGAYSFQMGTGAGSGAASGAATGASIGSAVPIVGTAIGAVVGAVVGAIAGAIGKKDPEDANFQQAIQIYNTQGQQGVLNIPNKYLVLAGLFDLKSIHTNIPIYKKYGRMGEQRFVTDLCNLLYNAGQSGQIVPTDTIVGIKQRIVDPWIASWGYGPMADPNAGMIDTIILGMTAEYLMGGQGLWLDVNGNPTFRNLPNFTLPKATATPAPAPTVAPTVAPTPSGGITRLVTTSPSPLPAPPVSLAPAPTAVPALPSVPAQAAPIPMPNSRAGATITYQSGGSLVTPFGTFAFSGVPETSGSGYYMLLNGAQNGSGVMLQWTGSQVIAQDAFGRTFTWDATGQRWQLIQQATAPGTIVGPVSAPPTATPSGGTAVGISQPLVPVSVPGGGINYAPAPGAAPTAPSSPVTAGLSSVPNWAWILAIVGVGFAIAMPQTAGVPKSRARMTR